MIEERALVVVLWEGAGVGPDDYFRPNAGAILTSEGSKWEDQTGVPGGSVTYSIMCYGTTAELDLIDALADAYIEWREPWPEDSVAAVTAMSGPDDLPDASAFGQMIASLVPNLYPTAPAAQAIFGASPGGRSWKEIGDEGIANQKIAGGV